MNEVESIELKSAPVYSLLPLGNYDLNDKSMNEFENMFVSAIMEELSNSLTHTLLSQKLTGHWECGFEVHMILVKRK